MTTHDTVAGDRGRHEDDGGRRVLVVAAERCVGAELIDELRARAGSERTRIRVVAPALMSRLQFWASDETPARDAAAARLEASLAECRAAGVDVEGVVGDGDPLQAIDDEVRLFAPDEIVVATHPEDRENWLEHDLVPQARRRHGVPITHVVVDAATGRDTVVPPSAEPTRAARERHRVRDVVALAGLTLLAVVGTLISLVLYGADVPGPLLVAWVLVMDLGVKLLLIVAVWSLFLRRGRADRLDY